MNWRSALSREWGLFLRSIKAGGGATVIVALIALALTLAGCSHSAPKTADPAASSTTVRPTPAPGAPSDCFDLTKSAGLRGLATEIRGAQSGSSPDVADAVAVLRSFTGTLNSADAAADALEHWEDSPTDGNALAQVASTFEALDQEARTVCGFRVS